MDYKKLFVAYLCLVPINLGWANVFLRILAYILFFLGLKGLSIKNSKYKLARNMSIPLILLSFINFYQIKSTLSNLTENPMDMIIFVLGIVSTVVFLFMAYGMFMGIKEEAKVRGYKEYERKLQSRWNLCMGYNILVVLLSLNTSPAPILYFAVMLIGVLVYILIVTTLYGVEGKLKD